MDEVKKIKDLLHVKLRTYVVKFRDDLAGSRFSLDSMDMEIEAFSEEDARAIFLRKQSAHIISIEEKK